MKPQNQQREQNQMEVADAVRAIKQAYQVMDLENQIRVLGQDLSVVLAQNKGLEDQLVIQGYHSLRVLVKEWPFPGSVQENFVELMNRHMVDEDLFLIYLWGRLGVEFEIKDTTWVYSNVQGTLFYMICSAVSGLKYTELKESNFHF